ncbi:MAG TPA: LTA synthase family protein [Cyclobacteriaceae bacterium]|nr:LTA synthase family protein [Cyclobacteriaceae bacterium]
MKRLLTHRFGLIALLTFILVFVSFVTRTVLLVQSYDKVEWYMVPVIYVVGLFFDLVNSSYVVIPLTLYVWLVRDKIFTKGWHRFVLYGIFVFFTYSLIFNAVSEWLFWDEFNSRYNFIAVDYLIYTTEVLGNIQQSYPVGWIITVVAIITFVSVFLMRSWIRRTGASSMRFKERTKYALIILAIPVLMFLIVKNTWRNVSNNPYVNELAGNGVYELFAAYRNNELDYDRFYNRIEDQKAFEIVRNSLKTPEAEFIGGSPYSIERKITNPGPEKQLNVVMVSVESLSADYLGIFGNPGGYTPNLDSLSKHSLLFTNLYATGTRTVRGLEALSLCVPPTPGQSIVRRPNNDDLFTIGSVFESKGYESRYIYGGYGYFDNMNGYFSANGYEVTDRDGLSDEEIDYENIWGVADENLFTLAQREIDKTIAAGKPVFAQVMTTSNHRPFTYPEGRIDIPSHTGREGAVKYTDYAIGRFIRECSKKPWFENTLFIIVADHCSSSAGTTNLPVHKYHIPMMIYSPAHVTPGKMERMMSQIDIGPTLFGMLNFSYNSKFYGFDMNKLEPGRERVFISTYQLLGFIRSDQMIILSPQQKNEELTIDWSDKSATPSSTNADLVMESIAWYQAASYSFKNGLMKK